MGGIADHRRHPFRRAVAGEVWAFGLAFAGELVALDAGDGVGGGDQLTAFGDCGNIVDIRLALRLEMRLG